MIKTMSTKKIDAEAVRFGEYYYNENEKLFYAQNSTGDWVSLSQSQFIKHLKMMGVSSTKDPAAGIMFSAVDETVQSILMDNRVSYCGPLAGWGRGLQEFDGSRALVTTDPNLIQPKPGAYDVLMDFLLGLFSDPAAPRQVEYLLGWWQFAIQSMYSLGKPRPNMALAIAGPVGCGKTLLKEIIKTTMGREVYPYDVLKKNGDLYGADLSTAPLWVIDDETSSTRYADRLAFGDSLKKICAASAYRARGLHQAGITLRSLRCLVICLNDQPEKLAVLPPLDDDISDKITILKASGDRFPMPMSTQEEKDEFWRVITAELPGFLDYLLNTHTISEEIRGDRYGISSFHHPDIAQELYDMGQEVQLIDWIDRVLFSEVDPDLPVRLSWEGSTTELRNTLIGDDSALTFMEKSEVSRPSVLGKQLTKLARRYPDRRFKRSRVGAGTSWALYPKNDPQPVRGEGFE